MNGWGWTPDRADVRRFPGSGWLQAAAFAAPFVTVGLLLVMMHMIGGTMTAATGVLFELPDAEIGDEAVPGAVAVVVPMRRETIVFFDDSRYVLGNGESMRRLEERMSARLARPDGKSLLLLADRRVSCADLTSLAQIARRSGAEKLLVAERRGGESRE